jgi:DNA-binding transcriptional MerR regulator
VAKASASPSLRANALTAQEAVDAHSSDDTSDLLGIAPLCEAMGITARALRLYEDKGLLQPKRINGARVYNRRDRARLTLILRAKALGSSLVDIKQYLDMYGAHGEGRAKQLDFVLKRTDAAIAELEEKRAQIDATLAEIRLINASVRQRLQRI